MAVFPALTVDERNVLTTLTRGAVRTLAPAIRGHLSLYGLITETPAGWIITALGKEAWQKAPAKRELPEVPPERPRPDDGKRFPLRRRSPF
jgi:hypothetical protein